MIDESWPYGDHEGPLQWDEPEEDNDWPYAFDACCPLLAGWTATPVVMPPVSAVRRRVVSAFGPNARRDVWVR